MLELGAGLAWVGRGGAGLALAGALPGAALGWPNLVWAVFGAAWRWGDRVGPVAALRGWAQGCPGLVRGAARPGPGLFRGGAVDSAASWRDRFHGRGSMPGPGSGLRLPAKSRNLWRIYPGAAGVAV